VTRELLDFQEAFPDVGRPFTPIALVLDAAVLRNPAPWAKLKEGLFRPGEAEAQIASQKDAGLAEAPCYPACAVAELFDIVPSDAPRPAWDRYQVVIPVGDGRAPPGVKALPSGSSLEQLVEAARELSPLARSTRLPMQINHRRSDGAWIVGLYNPWGARRGDVLRTGSILTDRCTVREQLRPRFPVQSARAIHAWPASSTLTVARDTLQATVGPGGTLILEIVPKTAY
jgi:hypothetical protein